MATWSIHHRRAIACDLGSLGSKLLKFSIWHKVKARRVCGIRQACASKQFPLDGYEDLDLLRSERQERLQMQCQITEDGICDLYRSIFSLYCLGDSERNDLVLAPTRPILKNGIFGVVLATAATSVMLGMALVGRQKLPKAVFETSLLLHPPLAAIQTQVSGGRGEFRVPTRTSPVEYRPELQYESDYAAAFGESLSQLNGLQLGGCSADLIDLTIARAAAYNSVLEIPNPRRWGCWVSDQAGLMSGSVVEHMNSVLDALYYETGTEVAVVTIEAIGNPSVSSKDFAEKLFSFWKMDTESDGNKILLLFIRAEGKLEVEVGRALEKTLQRAQLWSPKYGWLSKASMLLGKGQHGNAMVMAVESLAETVWEAAGSSVYHPPMASSWWQRCKPLDLACLSLPILLVGGHFISGTARANEPGRGSTLTPLVHQESNYAQ